MLFSIKKNKFEKKYMSKRRGRKSAAQTPAPKAEQIKGSKKNPKGTAASELSAARIKLSSDTLGALKKKLDEFKEKHPKKKNVTLNDLKAVYRRGSGAYSSSHRPTITGGRPNSRAAWSYARVNKFLEKAAGKKVKAAYIQDDDLLKDGGNISDDIFANGGKTKGKGDCYKAAGDFAIGSKFYAQKIDFKGEPYIVHAEVTGQGSIEGLRYGHAWVEDDFLVYDYSNNREIVFPKEIYYLIGQVNTQDSKKYQKYTFEQARKKMLDTGNYGSWDIETEYADGGNVDVGKLKKDLEDFLDKDFYSNTKYSDVSKSCDLAKGNCYDISEELMGYLKDIGYKNMSLVEVRNPLFELSGAHNEWKKMSPNELFHIILKVDDKFIDLTGVQYQKQQEGIKIYDEEQLSSLWGKKEYFSDGGKIIPNDEEYMKYGGITKEIEEEGQQITCVKCDWSWNTSDSEPDDKYVCHNCGFDNSLFYDTDILKPNLTVHEIAEKHNVDVDYVLDQLIKGSEHELEHTERNDIAKRIALHHIAETPDYYEKLDEMDLEDGAEIEEIILEDNTLDNIEVDIQEYLMQQNAEAQEVMSCSDSRIFKTMICKTKIEIAQNRLENCDNPEEQNCWNECMIIWTDCLDNIVENNIPVREYKDGGTPCGCSKMYEKGGLAYGNSHDKGGMPLEVSSTGQKIEIEGGEGVVNKRSMQSTKKVDFEGRKLTPCEVVSKINEMGGGVKFKCSDVKEIIAEDGHF